MYPYPSDLPSSDVLDIVIDALRQRSVDKARAAHCTWHVAGYALSQVLPDERPLIGQMPMTDGAAAELLEDLRDRTVSALPQALPPIPWRVLLPVLLKLFLALAS